MNTTQLECFMAVANTLNFSRAAEQLRLTQPAVSHQINSLEDELGVRLFKRTSKSVRLTQEGYLYTQYAGEILRLFNVSKGRLRETRAEQQRILGIGCRNTLELRLLTRAVRELKGEVEAFIPSYRVVAHDSLENLLLDGEIQLMPTFRENAPKQAAYRELALCPIVCAVPADSELADRSILSVEEIASSRHIAISRPNASPRTVTLVQNQLIAEKEPGSIIFCDSLELLSAVVSSGFASAVMAATPGTRVNGVKYIPVEGTEPVSYGAAYMTEELSPVLRRLMQVLIKHSRDYAGEI